jgi:hypothetical protein
LQLTENDAPCAHEDSVPAFGSHASLGHGLGKLHAAATSHGRSLLGVPHAAGEPKSAAQSTVSWTPEGQLDAVPPLHSMVYVGAHASASVARHPPPASFAAHVPAPKLRQFTP